MEDAFKKVLIDILSNYKTVSQNDMRSENAQKFIRRVKDELAGVFKNKTKKDSTLPYYVKVSFGMGNWAEVPWIGVFDKELSTKASKGYDIVYLFRSDMSGVYLSLNQGYTYFKKDIILKITKRAFQKKL